MCVCAGRQQGGTSAGGGFFVAASDWSIFRCKRTLCAGDDVQVRAAAAGQCSVEFLDWLLKHGCPTGPVRRLGHVTAGLQACMQAGKPAGRMRVRLTRAAASYLCGFMYATGVISLELAASPGPSAPATPRPHVCDLQVGMAYACAMGTQDAGEAPPPQAMKAVGYMHSKGVPLGVAALEDLWRLPASLYKEYVVSHGLPSAGTGGDGLCRWAGWRWGSWWKKRTHQAPVCVVGGREGGRAQDGGAWRPVCGAVRVMP